MGKERVEPDWPLLTLDELRTLFTEFTSIGEPAEILSVSPRPFAAASVVGTGRGRVFVKRHSRTVRDREGLAEEHRFMAHLLRNGALVPKVIATSKGETAVEMGNWCYEIHEAVEGIDIYRDALSWTPFFTAAHARSAGQAMARIHVASVGYNGPRRQPRPLVSSFTIFANKNPDAELSRYIEARPALAEYLHGRSDCSDALELLVPFHAELFPMLPEIESLWTHNDLHASNLIWSHSGWYTRVASVIDFGLCDRTNAVHDLALAIERNIIEWIELAEGAEGVPVHFDHLEALLAGYESVRTLSDVEAAALAPMLALCHAEYALSEAEYLWGILHSGEKAQLASDGYLVGHARWFHSQAGERLLSVIRNWAEERTCRDMQFTQQKVGAR
jgi:Ser/Thr protein kinase RdoA (MazF antagonist)